LPPFGGKRWEEISTSKLAFDGIERHRPVSRDWHPETYARRMLWRICASLEGGALLNHPESSVQDGLVRQDGVNGCPPPRLAQCAPDHCDVNLFDSDSWGA
jgi:hypothetical protein